MSFWDQAITRIYISRAGSACGFGIRGFSDSCCFVGPESKDIQDLRFRFLRAFGSERSAVTTRSNCSSNFRGYSSHPVKSAA